MISYPRAGRPALARAIVVAAELAEVAAERLGDERLGRRPGLARRKHRGRSGHFDYRADAVQAYSPDQSWMGGDRAPH